MIETFKVINEVYNNELCEGLLTRSIDHTTRGHQKKLYKHRPRLERRKFSFCHRVVDVWNGLPDKVVGAENVMSFEKRLDEYWKYQPQKFYFQENIDNKINTHTRQTIRPHPVLYENLEPDTQAV